MRQNNGDRAASSKSSAWRKGPHANARDAVAVPACVRLHDSSGTALWPVWDTTLHLVVTSRDRLADARRLVIDQVAAIDAACNPYRADSEVRMLQRAHGRPIPVSAVLADLVAVSLRAALFTTGTVDLPSGDVLACDGERLLRIPPYDGGIDEPAPLVPDWRSIHRDGRNLTVPAGALLDVSAMARAYAVDRCARLIHKRFKVGARVGIGGDIAIAGQAPSGGWGRLAPSRAVPVLPVQPRSTALATVRAGDQQWRISTSPLRRTTRRPASWSTAPVWRSVSVAAFPCTYAKTLSTAAMTRAHAAPNWLRGLGVAAGWWPRTAR